MVSDAGNIVEEHPFLVLLLLEEDLESVADIEDSKRPTARAGNGGVAPPGMSTLAKARGYSRGFPWFVFDIFTQYQEQGPDLIAALLTGYGDALKEFNVPPGRHYNVYFPGRVIAMVPPLKAGQFLFDDDVPQTIDQYSKDVAAFLMWAAEPHLVARKRIGLQVMIFLIVLTGLLYFTKKRVWSTVLVVRSSNRPLAIEAADLYRGIAHPLP